MKILVLILTVNLIALSNFAQNGIVEIDTIYTNEDVEKGIVLINKEINELNKSQNKIKLKFILILQANIYI